MKPYKIRSMTMKNFAENTSKNSQTNPMKNQILKWTGRGKWTE
jgi:hypothetical protein